MFVAPEILRVQIPLPFPLKLVNCYLLHGPEGWALIDTGINWPPAIAAWEEALQRFDLPFSAVHTIYVTHHHPDHVGLAGWWQQRSGAPVLMTPGEAAMVRQVWGNPRAGQATVELFTRYGMPASFAATLLDQTSDAHALIQPLAEITDLEGLDSAELRIVGRCFQPLVLAGHAEEQLLLYEAATRTLLAADQVLPRISPNISIFPGTRPDPLGRFLASFPALAALDVAAVLPGHGAVFADLRGRLAELREHHHARLDQTLAAIGAAATGYQVAARVFPLDALSSHQVQFAMGETLAHLDHLVVQGRAELIGHERPVYRPC